ncbi:MAG: sugar kinase [Oscillospiraceae bacterium]|jgi:2-dehydro-3-deoxygluconokinase|nr:sugar kinase [Oscillospiraceae bacterium]
MKIVTFGELMLRLAPPGYGRFVQADSFGVTFGGGEANVAVSLAGFGADAAFVGKLPEHEIGQSALNSLRRYGVDTAQICRGGARLGIYYLEKGASQRPSKVIYDRAGSAFALCTADEYDWERILNGADWFHFTGITPALGGDLPQICLDALHAAKRLGVRVSCDLNYRANLWSRETAGRVMSGLMPLVDVCICNEEDAADVFGIRAAGADISGGKLSHEGYIAVAEELTRRFGLSACAITLRESRSASDNNWGALLYGQLPPKNVHDGDNAAYFSRQYSVHIVDRVGGGDSFAAGLIYAMLSGFEPQQQVEFAAAASCLKHSIEGDCNLVSAAEVLRLAGGDASGRVRR